MSHYYSRDHSDTLSDPRRITYDFRGDRFVFLTDKGVFSRAHVDAASDFLLKTVVIEENARVLDLGCGYGVLGIVIARHFKADVTLSDVNRRALALASENVQANRVDAHVVESDGLKDIDGVFDHIVTNPPIRIGKAPLYTIFAAAFSRLSPAGSLWIVMHKKHGALSALAHISSFANATVVKRHKGWHVITCKKH